MKTGSERFWCKLNQRSIDEKETEIMRLLAEIQQLKETSEWLEKARQQYRSEVELKLRDQEKEIMRLLDQIKQLEETDEQLDKAKEQHRSEEEFKTPDEESEIVRLRQRIEDLMEREDPCYSNWYGRIICGEFWIFQWQQMKHLPLDAGLFSECMEQKRNDSYPSAGYFSWFGFYWYIGTNNDLANCIINTSRNGYR